MRAKVPRRLEGVIGCICAQPVCFRLDSVCEEEIGFGDERVTIAGDTIIEHMVFTLRCGREPDGAVYRHAPHPPALALLHGAD